MSNKNVTILFASLFVAVFAFNSILVGVATTATMFAFVAAIAAVPAAIIFSLLHVLRKNAVTAE